MSDNYFDKLNVLLKKEELFVSQEGELLKNQIQEYARKNDPRLITLLLSDKSFKEFFFFEVENILIFDKEKFIRFISNKQFLPDSYTAFKNKIGLTADDEYLSENKEVVLTWPYKDCILEAGMTQEDQKRDEIFFNETLAPDDINRLLDQKVFTGFKRIDKDGEHKLDGFKRDEKGVIKDNLIIKGNNLLTLASLQKEFSGNIKLIYIDPPYNTGGDSNTFAYNNSFNHSSWLTFIKNRLEIAKKLLSEDGVLVIAIDDSEQAHLKILCDEMFGRENFVGTVIVQSNPRGRTTNTHFATTHEYAMFYAKDIDQVSLNFVKLTKEQELDFDKKDESGDYRLLPFRRSGGTSTPEERPNSYYPIYFDEKNNLFSLDNKIGYLEILPIDKLGKKRVWRQTRPSFLEAVKRGDIVCKKTTGKCVIYMKDRIKDGRKPKTIWTDSKYDASANGTMLLKNIFLGEKLFSYPKSLYTVKDTIDIITEHGGDEIVLDFFAGSGTTAHAVMDLNKDDGGNRRFILCEQLDYVDTVTKERVNKVIENNGKGDFIFMELSKWNEKWIEKIEKAKTGNEHYNIWNELKDTSFLSYKVDIRSIDANVKVFADLNIADQKKFLIECLDKNMLYVNYSEINDTEYGISENDKILNKNFYGDK